MSYDLLDFKINAVSREVSNIKECINSLSVEFSLFSAIIIDLTDNTDSMVNLMKNIRDDINNQDGKVFLHEKILSDINNLKAEMHIKKKYVENFMLTFKKTMESINIE
jgi:hypothetical protein